MYGSVIPAGNRKVFISQRDSDIVCYPETTSFILCSPIGDNPECTRYREKNGGVIVTIGRFMHSKLVRAKV